MEFNFSDEDSWYDALDSYYMDRPYFVNEVLEPNFDEFADIDVHEIQQTMTPSSAYQQADSYGLFFEDLMKTTLTALGQNQTVIIFQPLLAGKDSRADYNVKILRPITMSKSNLLFGHNEGGFFQVVEVAIRGGKELRDFGEKGRWSIKELRELGWKGEYGVDIHNQVQTYEQGGEVVIPYMLTLDTMRADFLGALGFVKKVELHQRQGKMVTENHIYPPRLSMSFWRGDKGGSPTIYHPSNTRYPLWLVKAFKKAQKAKL